ncbi:MAG TPA: Smr/MutS family protein [Thermoanaerobaculia bacterium]|nr:Smr/MutS family protein [Thermoanaerobaculia bacterium]
MHDDDPDDPPEAERVVVLELGDVVDLHGFRPGDVREVVLAALDAAVAAGRRELRLIHGRGIGVQRESIRALLARDPRVLTFHDAPATAGGWGATCVVLR